jgi:hypothetical protein
MSATCLAGNAMQLHEFYYLGKLFGGERPKVLIDREMNGLAWLAFETQYH